MSAQKSLLVYGVFCVLIIVSVARGVARPSNRVASQQSTAEERSRA
jgi:hypothetical protein